MSEVKIKAESRTQFGKGAARRIRRAGLVPAVLYGHGTDPLHVALPGHDLMLALKGSNALLAVDLGDKTELAIPKQVQRDPIKGFLEHVDLLIVKRGEKVVVEIPVVLEGEAVSGSMVQTENNTLTIEAEATHIPGQITISIEGLEIGTQIHAGDVKLPAGSTFSGDPETLVVNISAAPTAEQLEGETEGDAAETAAEGDDASAEGEAAASE